MKQVLRNCLRAFGFDIVRTHTEPKHPGGPRPAAEPTELCRLAENFGSDKCRAIFHSYTPAYYFLLKATRESCRAVLEIGIGNPGLMKNIIGKNYQPGA